MSYEFVPVTDQPTVPEHWSLRASRIYDAPYFIPTLIAHGSLIADKNADVNPRIYIDTADKFVPENKVSFGDEAPMTAVMHVRYKERGVEGYIADLRYYGGLTLRPVSGHLSYEEIEQNRNLKTQALLGSVCLGMSIGTLEIRSQFADLPELQRDFSTLLSYVDTLRAQKSATVSTIGRRLDIDEKNLKPHFTHPGESSD